MGLLDVLDPGGQKLREENPDPFGKGGGPGTPDFKGAAEATAESNERINTGQTYANRPTTSTPWGSQSWKTGQTIDPATGKPVTTWESQQSLDPRMQAALDSQMRMQQQRSGAAEGLMGQATDSLNGEFDWDSAPDFGGSVDTREMDGDSSAYRQRAQDAVDQLNAPDLAARREGAEAQLAAQGITPGSDAYNNAMRQISDNESRSHLMAIDSGRQEAGQMFNQDLAGNDQGFKQDMAGSARDDQLRQMMIAEQMQKRGMPLADLEALMNGQNVANPGAPQMTPAGKSQGADYSGAMSNQYNAQLSQYNAQQAQQGQTMQAGVGLASALMMMY